MRKFSLRDIAVKDVLISTLILFVTFGYFFDSYIAEGITEVNFLGITIGSFGFEDIAHMLYFSKMKLLIIVFSLIWYFTCKHWWKPAILVITTIELLKFFSTLNSNQDYFDNIEFVSSLPITIPIILLIILISKKVNDYNLSKNLRYELDDKINDIFFELNEEKKESIENLKKNFTRLKMNKKMVEDELEYLNELIEMRDNFYKV